MSLEKGGRVGIRAIYTNGDKKIFPYKEYKKLAEDIAADVNKKTGIRYIRFLEGSLQKLYIDNELLIDREKLLGVAE